MNKEILVNVNCANENLDDIPNQFYVELNDTLIERIKHLARVTTDNSLYCVEEFNANGVWIDESLYDTEDITEDALVSIRNISDNAYSLELLTLIVKKDEFLWSGIPKHMGDAELLTTGRIPLSFLDDAEPLYVKLGG